MGNADVDRAQLAQCVQVGGTGYRPRAEVADVDRIVLEVEEPPAALQESSHEVEDGDLACSFLCGELRVGGEHRAELEAEHAADEAVLVPDLAAVRVTGPMECAKALAHAAGDPRRLASGRAGVYDVIEGGVNGGAPFGAPTGEAAHGPGILLLDEPTASLDLRHQLDLLKLAREKAAKGTAVIAVLHDLNLATLFASRIVILDRGRIATDGTAAETITDEWLARVFKVTTAVGRVPVSGVPFVLPHSIGG